MGPSSSSSESSSVPQNRHSLPSHLRSTPCHEASPQYNPHRACLPPMGREVCEVELSRLPIRLLTHAAPLPMVASHLLNPPTHLEATPNVHQHFVQTITWIKPPELSQIHAMGGRLSRPASMDPEFGFRKVSVLLYG